MRSIMNAIQHTIMRTSNRVLVVLCCAHSCGKCLLKVQCIKDDYIIIELIANSIENFYIELRRFIKY